MRNFFRVVSPFFIYIAVTNLTVLAVLMLYVLWYLVSGSGANLQEALYSGTVFAGRQSVYMTALSAVITTGILLVFYRYDCILRGDFQKFTPRIPAGWIYLVLTGISICIAGNNFIEMIRLSELFPGYDEVAGVLYSIPFPAQLLCIGFLIPAAEEMVFRVLGFRRLRDRISFWPAAILSAFLFGCFHGNVVQGAYAFLLGLVIAYVYELSDNPLTPILVHCCANLVSVLFTALPEYISSPALAVKAAELVLFLGITAYCLIKLKQYGRPQNAAVS